MNMQFSNREQPWVVDGKLIIDDSMLEFMDMAKTITEKGYDLNVDPWAPEWSAAVESDDTFCYVLPTWGYQFVVKPSAVNTVGQWALCEGPVPYVKGGTWLGIYKDSPNKDLAWAFMELSLIHIFHNFQTCQNLFRAGKTLVARSPVTEFPGRHKLTCFFHHIIELEFHVRRVKRFEKQSISYRRMTAVFPKNSTSTHGVPSLYR